MTRFMKSILCLAVMGFSGISHAGYLAQCWKENYPNVVDGDFDIQIDTTNPDLTKEQLIFILTQASTYPLYTDGYPLVTKVGINVWTHAASPSGSVTRDQMKQAVMDELATIAAIPAVEIGCNAMRPSAQQK